MKAEIESGKCIGVETCIALAPGAFTMGPAGVALVLDPITDTSDSALDTAIDSCPLLAIRRVDG